MVFMLVLFIIKKNQQISGGANMALSDAEIEATKVPYGKNQFKISDGAGLYLLVKSSGRYWKLAYRFEGKQKTLAFGVYPAVGIEQAREKRDHAKLLLAENIDPGEVRKQERMEQRQASVVNKPLAASSHASNGGLIQQPAWIDPEVQKQMQQRRLSILKTLERSKTYAVDEGQMKQALDAQGLYVSFDRLRTDLAWLYEQQAVHIQIAALWVIQLTQSGLDTVQGRTWIPGIDRPSMDEANDGT